MLLILQKPYPACICTLAYTYFKKCYFEIFNQRKQDSSSYVCLAEQYLRTCRASYLSTYVLGFTELAWQIR